MGQLSENGILGRWVPVVVLAVALATMSCLVGCRSTDSTAGYRLVPFEGSPQGLLPIGWSQTGQGEGVARWEVIAGGRDAGSVLAQVQAENPNRHYNLAIWENLTAADLVLEVGLKAMSGEHDQGGGLVWRFQDPRNYYVARYNPLEQNVVAYKVVDGVRSDMPLVGLGRTYGAKVTVPPVGWHRLKVVIDGPLFDVSLDGLEVFHINDHTFTKPGRIGLWTKADAVTWFDNLSVRLIK